MGLWEAWITTLPTVTCWPGAGRRRWCDMRKHSLQLELCLSQRLTAVLRTWDPQRLQESVFPKSHRNWCPESCNRLKWAVQAGSAVLSPALTREGPNASRARALAFSNLDWTRQASFSSRKY